jgi:hypothetical protein
MVESEESSDVLVESAERPSALRARDFVGWCWSFGSDFHNSPDITNLRYWMRKFQCSVSSEEEEGEILVEARRLFLKKVGQAVRKADVPKDKD